MIALLEVEFRKISPMSGRHLRRQLLQLPKGWILSNVVEVGDGPKSLRGYDGGWHFGDKVFRRRELAENNLRRNGWFIAESESDPDGYDHIVND